MVATTIKFACSQCGKKYSTQSTFQGKAISCSCGTKLIVPSPSPAALSGSRTVANGAIPAEVISQQITFPTQTTYPQSPPGTMGRKMQYAGFGKRFAACFLDGIITSVGSFVIFVIFDLNLRAGGTEDPATLTAFNYVLGLFLGWLYSAVMESSPTQGTLGKMALGIKVTDMSGDRVSFGKATGRHFGKMISALILGIGFLMVAFTEKKQSLHDIMAGCLVVNK